MSRELGSRKVSRARQGPAGSVASLNKVPLYCGIHDKYEWIYLLSIHFLRQVLRSIPDQDTFYDISDALEDQEFEKNIKLQAKASGSSSKELTEQLHVYETMVKEEDMRDDGARLDLLEKYEVSGQYRDGVPFEKLLHSVYIFFPGFRFQARIVNSNIARCQLFQA